MRVIVTGGAGFIGSALVRHLVGKQCEVLNIDALTYAGYLPSLSSVSQQANYSFLNANICDRNAVEQAITDFRPDRIMHLAAETHVDRSIDGPSDFIATNVTGTVTLLEAALAYWSGLDVASKRAFRFVHVSTDEVYGSLGEDGRFTEQTRYDPSSPYAASKASADHFARVWQRTYGLPVVVSNCSNTYGPFQFPEKLIPLTILNALAGEPLPVYGRGENVRDWIYVDDHVRALDLIADRGRPGETYNVGSGSERTNIDVVRFICAVLDRLLPADGPREELIEFVADRPGHDTRYAIDSSKIERELGWRPEVSFENGIERTVRWYIGNEWWWQPLRERYSGKRLGLVNSGKRVIRVAPPRRPREEQIGM